MTEIKDANKLDRTARFLLIEVRRGVGSPPFYGVKWQPLWGAKVDRIEINHGSKSNVTTIWFPQFRWQQAPSLRQGDMVRITTNEFYHAERTIVFSGFLTSFLSDFSGGDDKNPAYERVAIVCMDYRWLLKMTTSIVGQIARGPDDYTNYGQPTQAPIDYEYTWLSGQRCIFNANGKPNRDPVDLSVYYAGSTYLCDTPIFADESVGQSWTAGQMIRHILSPMWNHAFNSWPICDPALLTGLNHADMEKVISHVVVDGLNVIDALEFIVKQIGFSFREDYGNDGFVNLVFYKIGDSVGYVRDYYNPTILQQLHAPAVGENIKYAVEEGKKMLWAASIAEDIGGVVNMPMGLGMPDRFEFTSKLVPAWLDSDLVPDTSDDNANLYFTEAELQEETSPNTYSYYQYYHPRGDSFKRDVGRKWVLNLTGLYTNPDTYDRGMPFDWATIIPPRFILDSAGKRLYGPFNRELLPCLTFDKDSLNTVGIKVEFSFDAGVTWQVIPAMISALKKECGIYIDEANLAELVDQAQGNISGGTLDGEQLNYYTSLADDSLNSRSFKNNQWKTRIRVTASVQMDQRLWRTAMPTSLSGSPFHQMAVYDYSQHYGITNRTPSSIYNQTALPAWNLNTTPWFDKHLKAVRAANEDMSISGSFTLERFWLGDGSGAPDFAVGDCIEKITGRELSLSAAMASTSVYPEIIQLIYLPDNQMMKLITRDLRFAQVLIN
jgi:hypothetical protein